MLPDAVADHYREQQKVTGVVLAAAQHIWGDRAPRDFDYWFGENVDQLTALLVAGQQRAVAGADEYVAATLEELGTPVAPEITVDTRPLIGVASDGRPLDSLLYGSVITTKSAVARSAESNAVAAAQAWTGPGLHSLLVRMQVQVADAARVATGLSIAARRDVGYVRMMNPPSCPKCLVLAGRFYRYSAGFLRHPQCDCRHIPSREDTANDIRTDPDAYFRSLSEAEQDQTFTIAGAQAIRDGADINQVVNARRGMTTAGGRAQRTDVYGQDLLITREGVTRHGVAGQAIRARGRNAATTPRLMPEAIYEIADSRDEALRLLQMNGYVIERRGSHLQRVEPSRGAKVAEARPPVPAAGGGGGGGRPPGRDVPVPSDDDGEHLAGLLEQDYAGWAERLTPEHLAAIEQWQRADVRFYQKVQAIFRTGVLDPDAVAVAELVTDAIEAGPLARDVHAWRGIRNSTAMFKVPNTELGSLVGRDLPADGLFAVSTSRRVSTDEFTDPSFGGGPVLLQVRIPAGTPAAWLPRVGAPNMAYQRELLLGDGHSLRVHGVDYSGELPVMDVEVI